MNIKINSIWTYRGPNVHGPENSCAPHGQLHQVVYSKPGEVITIGIPHGHGGSFKGTVGEFLDQFTFNQDKL